MAIGDIDRDGFTEMVVTGALDTSTDDIFIAVFDTNSQTLDSGFDGDGKKTINSALKSYDTPTTPVIYNIDNTLDSEIIISTTERHSGDVTAIFLYVIQASGSFYPGFSEKQVMSVSGNSLVFKGVSSPAICDMGGFFSYVCVYGKVRNTGALSYTNEYATCYDVPTNTAYTSGNSGKTSIMVFRKKG